MTRWPPDRVELLKCLWSEGLSAFLIAKELGAISKNSVIGKVHRLGLPGRRTEERKPYRGRPDGVIFYHRARDLGVRRKEAA